MTIRVEGFAIISEDGMLADASGIMPPELVIEADQQFLSDCLDRACLIVHGQNSHENQRRSGQRRRLIATRKVKTTAPAPDHARALLWNPAGISVEDAAAMLGVQHGVAAILGGTEIFGLFLPRYEVFYLSRAAGVRLPGGRAVFPQVPLSSPELVLSANGLKTAAHQPLDALRGVTLTTWHRVTVSDHY